MKPKLLITDGIAPEGQKLLEESQLFELQIHQGLSPEELLQKISEVDALVVRSATKVTSKILQAAKKLRIIGRAGIGIDNVDLGAATRSGVLVMNTPDENATTTAEHSIGLLFAAARKIPQANRSLSDGKWDRKAFTGTELFGKTAGIIGLGHIGKLVATRLLGLKMNVMAFDPYVAAKVAEDLGVKLVSLETLFSQSDIISVHVPLLEGTKNLIDRKALSKIKKGAILVNCARGGIVSEEAVIEALENKTLKAFATDVFEKEPPEPENPLLKHPAVVATPHVGAQTSEAQTNVSIGIAKQLIAYFQKGEVKNALNFSNMTAEEAERSLPYLRLGEKLGSFIAQWSSVPIEKLEIIYEGEVASMDTKNISSAIVRGWLIHSQGDRVNFVNALSVAAESGLQVLETKSNTTGEFHSSICLKGISKGKAHTLFGTLFGRQEPRLVQIDDLRLEASFAPHMLCIENEDKPGLVGSIGSTLGRHQINIVNLHLGLKPEGREALSVLSLSNPIPDKVVEEIKKLPSIISVKLIHV